MLTCTMLANRQLEGIFQVCRIGTVRVAAGKLVWAQGMVFKTQSNQPSSRGHLSVFFSRG